MWIIGIRHMSFSTPIALVLLVVLPVLAWIGRPRLAYRRRRDLASVLVRLIIVSLLILALAGLGRVQAADRLTVVFLFDNSDSISSAVRDQARKDAFRVSLSKDYKTWGLMQVSNLLVLWPSETLPTLSKQVGNKLAALAIALY